MKPTKEQIIEWAKKANFPQFAGGLYLISEDDAKLFAALAYEAGRKDENEACASLEVHLITPTRDYATMSPLDCYEAALMDEAVAFRAAIRARREQ